MMTNNFSATVDITTKCNLHCKHCRTEDVNYDLSLEQIEIIAKKLSHPKRRIVFISGGEPLTRSDIVDVVKIFKKYIPCVCINTNSLLLTETLLDELIDAGLNYIQVSLDGIKEKHEYVRGIGTYDATIAKLHLINTKSIKLHISCCISALNIEDIETLAHNVLIDEKIKVDILGFKRFIPKNEMAGTYNLKSIGLKKMYDIVERISNKYSEYTDIVVDFPQKNIHSEEKVKGIMKKYNLQCSGCSAATGGPCIRADGQVSPCSLLYVDAGNIFEQDLNEIYNNEVFTNLCERNLKGKCGDCNYKNICGGCRAAALAINNDYLSEDPECYLI